MAADAAHPGREGRRDGDAALPRRDSLGRLRGIPFFDYSSKVSPLHFHRRWEQHRVQQTEIDTLLCPYGDGGPDRDIIEMVRRMKDLEGVPRAHEGTLAEFFQRMEENPPKNRWGEGRAVSELAPGHLHHHAQDQAAAAPGGVRHRRGRRARAHQHPAPGSPGMGPTAGWPRSVR